MGRGSLALPFADYALAEVRFVGTHRDFDLAFPSGRGHTQVKGRDWSRGGGGEAPL